MENEINIAELLKDCPKGMELYSPIFGKVYLDKIRPHLAIVVTTDKYQEEFLYDGRYGMNGECMLFPSKGKTTWEGFVPPPQFKDGDIIFKDNFIAIISSIGEKGLIWYHCLYDAKYKHCKLENDYGIGYINDSSEIRLATEEEKQKLFDAIKENGYKWNAETKTLEKLVEQKFKVGDIIQDKNAYKVKIIEVCEDKEYYIYDSLKGIGRISFSDQDDYELVSNKFDISTLKPFESKVLVRYEEYKKWRPAYWGFYDDDTITNYHYYCFGAVYAQCIPYEGNEHLLGTTDDCDDFYKTW